MSIWLVTTGSSDVQLKTNEYWDDWYRIIKPTCYNLPSTPPLKPTRAIEDDGEPYRISSRALGKVYQAYSDEVWDVLEFPLLREFAVKLKDEKIDQIILLLTDQSQIFDETQREDLKCPYWQDTRELEPIYKRYFQTYFPKATLSSLVIAPQTGEPGLDDWNFVLNLVSSTLRDNISANPESVYISHQASTPAISSAVQFSSLARFRNNVQFLVSNEYQPEQTRTISRSTYLRGIQKQEAKALLDRHDYSGVEALISDYLENDKNTKNLLAAAIQWNFAKFDEFAKHLKKHEKFKTAVEERTKTENWWWTAYEAAYLGAVRFKQEDIVEAMFHSFRAFEGLAIKDAERNGISGKFGRKAFKSLRHRKQKEWNHDPCIKTLIDLDTTDEDQRNDLLDRRNGLFHQLRGFQKDELFDAWKSDELHWKNKVLECLNFISEKNYKFVDFDQESASEEVASLMVKVHQELAREIAAL